MSKTKGLLLMAAVAAMAFTFSCSSDDGKSNNGELVSCRFRETTTCESNNCFSVYDAFSMNEGTCVEIQMTELIENEKQKGRDVNIEDVEYECTHNNSEGIFSDGECPSGYMIKCISKAIYTAYYYGEQFNFYFFAKQGC